MAAWRDAPSPPTMETKEGEQDYLLGKPLSKANSSAGSVTNALIRRDSRTWTAPSAALKRISRPFDTAGQANSMIMFGVGLCVFQAVLLFFFGFFTTPYGEMIPDDSANADNFNAGYNIFSGVLIMMVIGFANLMTFIVNYEIGSVAFTLMVTVVGLQFGLFTEAFFLQLSTLDWAYVSLDIYSLIAGLYAVAAVLISFGAVIGKVTPFQLLVMTLMELVFYSLNNQVFMVTVFGVADIGGTIVIHEFGAFFGLACALVYGLPPDTDKVFQGRLSDTFSLLGTIFLWIYWPSFVGGMAVAGSVEQQKAMVNTVLALLASSTVAFAASCLLAPDYKLRCADIQNATLAGGVAIGAIANLTLAPATVSLVGAVAGLVSVLGFKFIQPWLEDKIALHDTCGINNLHGMPSLIGGLASVIVAYYKCSVVQSDVAVYGEGDKSNQWEMQLAGVAVTLVVALSSGAITGLVLRSIDFSDYIYFKDAMWIEEDETHHDINH